jgi:hypothetical protein
MNLKKIIREEIEDFTWITDAPLNPWLEYDAIIFDKKPKKKKVNNYIQLALNTKNPSNKGSWETNRKEDIESILRYTKNYGEAALMVDGYNNLVYADPSYYDGKTINSIKYSQLVNKNLNESEEDGLEWMMEPINPWSQYSMLIFDEEPTREEINNYIELALNTGRVSNKKAWEIGREQDIDGILEYIRDDGGAVLKIDQWGDLQYSDAGYHNSSHNAIKYSQLVNKNLNESEESGLGWMMKVNATPINMDDEWILVNDIDPSNIDEGIEIQKYLMNLGYDWFVKGEGLRQRKIYTMHHYPTKGLRGDLTYYSDREKGIANDTMEENKNAKIYYWSEVKPTYIKESEEEMEDPFKWVKEVEPPYVGMKFKIIDPETPKIVYTIRDMNETHMYLDWIDPNDYKEMKNFRWPIKHYLDFAIHGNIEVVNDTITESEEDEWAWAKESIFVDKVSMGDKVRVYNTGSEEAFLYWLSSYRENYENGLYGKDIEGVVIAEEEEAFCLSVKGYEGDTDSTIYFPYKSHMEFLESIDEGYEGLSIKYEIIFKP